MENLPKAFKPNSYATKLIRKAKLDLKTYTEGVRIGI